MVKFRQLFSFSRKEIAETSKETKLVSKSNGLKLLCAPLPPEKTDGFGKLLVIITAKSGKAHERNLFKRRAKSIFYEEKLYNNPVVSILIVYKQGLKLEFEQIREFLVKNLKTS